MTDADLEVARPAAGQRRLIAFFASLLIAPGAGQLARGRTRRAVAWFVATLLSPLLLPLVHLGAVLTFLLLYLACALDAALSRSSDRPLPRWRTLVPIWAAAFVLSAGLRIGYRTFFYEPFRTPSASMQPTLEVGDQFFVRKYDRVPRPGDLIVYQSVRDPHKDFIKRVVAVGGETVELRHNTLYLNGHRVPRKQLHQPCTRTDPNDAAAPAAHRCTIYQEQLGGRRYAISYDIEGPPAIDQPATRVPPGHIYVLGDNRDNSYDSRAEGPIALDHVRGIADFIWFSYGRSGIRWRRIGTSLR